MNSKQFKKDFPEVYEEFFQSNNYVISLPLVMNWASDVDINYKGIHIKQKLPLRIYLGINKAEKKGIEFGTIDYFDINEDKFIKSELIEYSHFINEFNEYFNNEISNEELDNGFEFNLLSETSKGNGLGYVSILGLLFNIGYEKITGIKNCNCIDKEKCLIDNKVGSIGNISDYLNKSTLVDNILRKTLQINKNFSRELSIKNQISSLFDSHYPIVTFLEGNYKEKKIDEVKFFGYKLNDLDKSLPKLPYAPIDYGLIYTGYPVYTDNIIHSSEKNSYRITELNEKIGGWFGDDINSLDENNRPLFIKEVQKNITNKEGEVFSRVMGFLSLDILDTILELYSRIYSEKAMKNFILNLNKITDYNKISKKCSTKFKKFLGVFSSNFKTLPWMFGLAPNDTMVMGGNAIFVVPTEGYRKYILDAVDKTRERIPGVRLIYSNWLDGIESKGFIIEQDISNNQYSDFIDKNNLLLIRKDFTKKIVKSNYIENNNFKGLLLDTINNKIIINGTKLTSKEIKSQNTTIDILLKLLEKKGDYVLNTCLAKSSYSTNKNDMSSKIIKPLEKLIKEKYNINLKISIIGTISNFKMKLDDNSLDINILKEI